MDMLQLICFEAAAKYESITKASVELFIPQPTISKQIQKLERDIGYQLFLRQGKQIRLNENGKVVLKYIKKLNSLTEDCKKELSDINEYDAGTVSLLVTSCSKLLPDILQKFRAVSPNTKLYITQSDYCDCDADLKLFSQNDALNCQSCIQLLREDICLAVPFGHPLAFHSSVSLNDLKKERFIMLKPESNLLKETLPFFKKHDFNPNIIMEAENPSLLRELISSNFGISIMPTITWGNAASMQVKLIPFKEVGLGRNIYLSWNSERYLSRSAQHLTNFIKSYFENIV